MLYELMMLLKILLKRSILTFHQGSYRAIKQAYEKMLSVTCHQINANLNNEILLCRYYNGQNTKH